MKFSFCWVFLFISLAESQSTFLCTAFSTSPSNRPLHSHFVGNEGGRRHYNSDYINHSNNRNSNSNNKENTDALSALSVTELKRLLAQRGVDFRDCLEKRDLVDRLAKSNPENGYDQDGSQSNARNDLLPDEKRLVDTFQRVSPAVAFITTATNRNDFSTRSLALPQEIPPSGGSGSGFLWDAQGHVVTNAHVVMQQSRSSSKSSKPVINVKLPGMATACPATIVGIEPEKDLAVLKIRSNDLFDLPAPLPVGTSSDLQPGQTVLAIGNPFGLDNTLTRGVVSATGRSIRGFGGRNIANCVQTDASINPGNSGGPLLDSHGRLVGVNTMIYSPGNTPGNVGIGFAIPVDTVRRVVNQILRYGRVVRPTLGLQVVDDRVAQNAMALRQQQRRSNKKSSFTRGVLTAEVLPGSPAAAVGIRPSRLRGDGSIVLGDLITHVNGQPTPAVEDLLEAIEAREPGDIVQLTVQRGCDEDRTDYVRVELVSRDELLRKQQLPRPTATSLRRNGLRNGVMMP